MIMSKELQRQWQQLEKRRDELLSKIPQNPSLTSEELVEEWMEVVHQRHTIFQEIKKEENHLKINYLMLKICRITDILLEYNLAEIEPELRELISKLHSKLLPVTEEIYQNGLAVAIENTISNALPDEVKYLKEHDTLSDEYLVEKIANQEFDHTLNENEDSMSVGQNYIFQIQNRLSESFCGDIPDIENLAMFENELPSKPTPLTTILECSLEKSTEICSDDGSGDSRNKEKGRFSDSCENQNFEMVDISEILSYPKYDADNNHTFVKEKANVPKLVEGYQDANPILVPSTDEIPETPQMIVTAMTSTPTNSEDNESDQVSKSSDALNESKILQLSTVSLSSTQMRLNSSFDLDVSDAQTPPSKISRCTPTRPNAPDLYLELTTLDTNIKGLFKSSNEKKRLKYETDKPDPTNSKTIEESEVELLSLQSRFTSVCSNKASLLMPDILPSSPQITRRIGSPKSANYYDPDSERKKNEQQSQSENIYKNKSPILPNYEIRTDSKMLLNKSSKIKSRHLLQTCSNSEAVSPSWNSNSICQNPNVRRKILSDFNKESKLEVESRPEGEHGTSKRRSSSSSVDEKSNVRQSKKRNLELNPSQNSPAKDAKTLKSKIPKFTSAPTRVTPHFHH